jgi:RNAse (barnase) inhibitor barstar
VSPNWWFNTDANTGHAFGILLASVGALRPYGLRRRLTLALGFMRTITIDCHKITSEASFWESYLASTKPEGSGHFGRNLDAFWDALNGGPGWPGEIRLRITNTAHMKSWRDGRFYQALASIAAESKHVSVLVE